MRQLQEDQTIEDFEISRTNIENLFQYMSAFNDIELAAAERDDNLLI